MIVDTGDLVATIQTMVERLLPVCNRAATASKLFALPFLKETRCVGRTAMNENGAPAASRSTASKAAGAPFSEKTT